ncbi:hypothetical protein BDF21DRAFT_399352 [Thamnidium elegans]|nr:hypothetical protein BDF21DRAFT_399352 [Thamnidium elegans]
MEVRNTQIAPKLSLKFQKSKSHYLQYLPGFIMKLDDLKTSIIFGLSVYVTWPSRYAEDKYISASCEWIDGRHADVLYNPKDSATEALPLVIVEIQNTVDKTFICHVMKYCGHIIDKYHVEPIALTICVHEMVAFGYVLTKQEASLLSLECRNDPTVQMLYDISRVALEHEIRDEERTVEVLLNVCENNQDQYKRIIEAIEED